MNFKGFSDGYGDLTSTTPFSKIFTIAFAILGIGLFVSFVGKLVALRMDQHKKYIENREHKTGKKEKGQDN